MSKLEQYLHAVSTRKALHKNNSAANIAILMELELNDIPRLLEIIRIHKQAIDDILAEVESDEDSLIYPIALNAKTSIDELAATGSFARWGEYKNGQNEISGGETNED